MSALSIEVPFPVFYDRAGEPLENGYVWIGQANLNPQTNPIQVYFDRDLTQPAAQPLRTLAGYISNAGTPAQIYVDATNFSILVQDKNGTMVYNFPDGTGSGPGACSIEYEAPFANSVPYSLCDKLAQTISVADFGAVGDGVTNDVAAFQNAINATPNSGVQVILVPSGSYAGNMLNLDYGNRSIVWNEQGSVSYVTAYPSNSYSDVFSGTQSQFSQSVFPEKHLKRFSSVRAGNGSGFIPGAVTIVGGAITNIAVTAGGANYALPRVLITGDGSGAVATATVVGGVITAINITSGGADYTQAEVYVVNGPVVVITGDSISTPNPTGTSPVYDGQYEIIQRAIQLQNPNRNITFFNRAVGATTWTTFDGIPSGNFPSWYTNTSKPWIDYIKELQPDLVICAFGMNDRQNFVPSRLRSSITKLIAFNPRPDVVLCTNMVPTAISSDQQFSSQASQIGRDFVAGYMRGYALRNNYGLVDIHRQFRLLRDGQDHRQTNLRYFTVDATRNLPYSFPHSGEGVFIKATFDCSPGNFWTNKAIELQISPAGANLTEYVRLSDNAGKLTISVQEYSGPQVPTPQFSLNTVIDTPTSPSSEFEILVVDQTLSVYVDGVEACVRVFAKAGGVFTPVLRRVDITTPSSPVPISDTVPTINAYAVGQYAQYQSRLNDYQLWGYGPPSGFENFGGNKVNHPSSFCTKYVIAPVVYATNFNQAGISIRSDTAANSNFIGVNETAPVALLHVTKIENPTTLTPAGNANNILIEDETNAGMSLMTSDTGAGRINFGDATNNAAGTFSFAHTTDRFSFIVQGNTSMTIDVPGADTITSAQLLVNIGGTLILKQVSVGIADSGGVGFRLLRVPN
jgi:hypothetical protein